MPMEDRVAEWTERERVRDVIASYCLALDEGNRVGVAQCFDSDALADYGPGRGGVHRGAHAIVARIAEGQSAFKRTHHQLGQILVSLDGDEAHSVSYVTAWHERFTGEREIACLRYIDVLRQANMRWSIHTRRVEAAFVDGFPGTAWDWVMRKHWAAV